MEKQTIIIIVVIAIILFIIFGVFGVRIFMGSGEGGEGKKEGKLKD